jgi:hypothetical protein
MFKLWRWTYARTFIQQERWWGRRNDPTSAAVCGTSLVIFMNLFTIVSLVKTLGLDIALAGRKLELGAAYVLIVMILYRRYVGQGRADQLITRLKRQNRAKTRREERKLWTYIAGSLTMPFIVGLVNWYLRRRWGS